jgi:uncharacterized protein
MREVSHVVAGCLVCIILLTASCATSGNSYSYGFQDEHSEDVLSAMDHASTDGHPDIGGEFQGVVQFAKGDYADAMKYFLNGARYADKPSQLCIGLMYLNGNGVQKDPVMAYAWAAVAAERKYPSFVRTRDLIWQRLSSSQRRQGLAAADKLFAEYGDAVAKPRMASQLRQDWLQGTASKTGYDDGRIGRLQLPDSYLYSWNAPDACAVNSIGGAPLPGCNNGIGGAALKPSDYFRIRDTEWMGAKGTVTVGPLQKVSAPKVQHQPSTQQGGS